MIDEETCRAIGALSFGRDTPLSECIETGRVWARDGVLAAWDYAAQVASGTKDGDDETPDN